MDETALEVQRFALSLFRFSQHTQDIRALSISTPCDFCLRFDHRTSLYSRNGGEDQHPWLAKGNQFMLSILKYLFHEFYQGEDSYLRDRWCLFDTSMLFFLWISATLQALELTALVPSASYLSILRAPRPLIMIRFIRVFLKFSMPKSRINQIFKYE